MNFVPLTDQLLQAYMGRQARTIQGFALMRGEEVVGVIGLSRSAGGYLFFSRVNDDVWDKSIAAKRLIIQCVRKMRSMMEGKRIYAFADEEREGSCLLLEHFGFKRFEDGSYRAY